MKPFRKMFTKRAKAETIHKTDGKMTQKIFYIIGILLVVLVKTGSAVNVGISPATMFFEEVMRDGYSEKVLVVSVDSEEEVAIEITPRGEIEDWLNYSAANFSVSKGNPYRLVISVAPPSDVPNGNYTGFLRVMTSDLGDGVEGHAVGIIRTSLDLSIIVEVTDIEVRSCRAYEFNVESVEKGDDVVFNFEVDNRGNIKLKPRITIDIWDMDQIEILESKEFSNEEILPTTKKQFEVRMSSNDLDLGQYWADVSVIDCYSKETLTFDVLEPGALKAEGVLLSILTNKSAGVGDTVPIEAAFKNTGEKEVEAYFKGKVSLGDKIVQILETDKINVPIDKIEYFNLFFTPGDAGRYVISGRVFYSSKKTFESSTVLEVFAETFSLRGVLVVLAYAALIAIIGILFFKIRKERKSYSNKLRILGK